VQKLVQKWKDMYKDKSGDDLYLSLFKLNNTYIVDF